MFFNISLSVFVITNRHNENSVKLFIRVSPEHRLNFGKDLDDSLDTKSIPNFQWFDFQFMLQFMLTLPQIY